MKFKKGDKIIRIICEHRGINPGMVVTFDKYSGNNGNMHILESDAMFSSEYFILAKRKKNHLPGWL